LKKGENAALILLVLKLAMSDAKNGKREKKGGGGRRKDSGGGREKRVW